MLLGQQAAAAPQHFEQQTQTNASGRREGAQDALVGEEGGLGARLKVARIWWILLRSQVRLPRAGLPRARDPQAAVPGPAHRRQSASLERVRATAAEYDTVRA